MHSKHNSVIDFVKTSATDAGDMSLWHRVTLGSQYGIVHTERVSETSHPELWNSAKEVSDAFGLDDPIEFYIGTQKDGYPNAFSMGGIPGTKPGFLITPELLDMLSENELKGVMGHKIGHITNTLKHNATTLAMSAAAGGLIYIAGTLANNRFISDDNPLLQRTCAIATIAGSMVAGAIAYGNAMRIHEFEAGQYGASVTNGGKAIITGLLNAELSGKNIIQEELPHPPLLFLLLATPFAHTLPHKSALMH